MDERLVPAAIVDSLSGGLGDSLVAIVLYGSRSRGRAEPDSDWDVLVIARDLAPRVLPRHVALKRLLPPSIRGAVSLYAQTPDEIRAAMPLPSLYHDIAVDGKVLHDPTGFATRWLSSARLDIEARGLHREETPHGSMWRRGAMTTGTAADGRQPRG